MSRLGITNLLLLVANIYGFNFYLLFRIQPNEETRKRQLEVWKSLVLEYIRVNKQFVIDVREALKSPLFNNTTIGRILCIIHTLMLVKLMLGTNVVI